MSLYFQVPTVIFVLFIHTLSWSTTIGDVSSSYEQTSGDLGLQVGSHSDTLNRPWRTLSVSMSTDQPAQTLTLNLAAPKPLLGSSIGATNYNEECTTYSDKLVSVPDLHNMIQYKVKRNIDFDIESVKSTNYQRSFYWCELDIEEDDDVYKRYRHFGFNTSHWWVQKGCGGWFRVTECKPATTSAVVNGHASSYERSDRMAGQSDLGNEDNSREEDDGHLHDQAFHPNNENLTPTSESLSPEGQPQSVKMLPPTHTKYTSNSRTPTRPVRPADKKISNISNTGALEGNVGQSDPWGAPTPPVHLDFTPQSSQPADSSTLGKHLPNKASAAVLHKSPHNNSVVDMYNEWPQVGYDFPTSLAMWDALDKATWVDVKAQLGFYAKYTRHHSATFE